MKTMTNGHEVVFGCVLDNHWGWHNHKRMIDEAIALGFELSDEYQKMLAAYDDESICAYADDECFGDVTNHVCFRHSEDRPFNMEDPDYWPEIVHDIMNEAEQWLNEHTPAMCFHCGKPVEANEQGSWWHHVSLDDEHACGVRLADHARFALWHWSDGDFFLSPWCGGDDDSCTDETCAHWCE